MKTIKLIFATVCVISLASCKKDRTCECTYTNSNGKASTYTVTYTKIKKGDAKDACSNTSSSETSGGDTSTDKTECKLK